MQTATATLGTTEAKTFEAFVAGTNRNNSDEFDGLIDDVQFYDEALSSGEVAFLFNNPGQLIPEPAAVALLGLGGVMMLGRRRLGRNA